MNRILNYSLFLLAIVWLIVHVIFFYKNGIVTVGESPKYIEEAGNLLRTGHLSSPNFWLYSTQILLILVALKLKLGFGFVVAVQLALSLCACWCFYRFVKSLFSIATAFVCTAFLLLNYPLHEFNTFLQTESLFYSFTIIFSTSLLRLEVLTFKKFIFILLGLILIGLTRPTGLLFVPPAFLYLFFRFLRQVSFSLKIGITVCVSIGFLFLLNSAIGSGGELDFMLPFRDERIICGVPTLPYFRDIKTAENSNSLYGLFYYILHNSWQFARLACRRSLAFFGLLRTYYSAGHNAFLGIFFYFLYILDLLSIKYWFGKGRFLLLYLFFIILLNWGTVILTCDDWHNRFFLTISPYLIILAAPAIKKFLSKFVPDDTTKPA